MVRSEGIHKGKMWATYVELARVLAQGSVVLLNEVPANLILGGGRRVVGSTLRSVGRNGRCGSILLLLVVAIAVCCHIDGFLCSKRVWVFDW